MSNNSLCSSYQFLYLVNSVDHFFVLKKLDFSAVSDTDNFPYLLKYVPI